MRRLRAGVRPELPAAGRHRQAAAGRHPRSAPAARPPAPFARPARCAGAAALAVVTVLTAITAGCNVVVHAVAAGRRRTPGQLHAGVTPDTAMVLGAGVRGQRPTPYLAARLDLAVRLWREGAISRILVSGWAEAPDDATGLRYDEPAVMSDYLVAHGVARGAVLRDPAGLDTWTSAVRARRLHGLDAMVVVTQAYHLPRALAAARMAGIDAFGVADTTRDHNAKWWRYRLREVPACVKLVGEWALSRTGLRAAARARRGDQ